MAAVPSSGRASRIEAHVAREAVTTRDLYERYANQIFRYCQHQLGSREEAEDAVQSTFLNAFRGLKRGVVPESESAWLFKIAENVCLSRRRSTWRRGRIESPADFEVVEELTPAPARLGDELMGLQDVLEQMPENQRRAILLREWQGLSYREIAEELELSQSAVETLIFRARRSLAAGLEQPPEPKRARVRRGADLGNMLAGLKSVLLGGSAAAKVAATVAIVSATTVAATAPVQHRTLPHGSAPGTPTPTSRGSGAPAPAPTVPAPSQPSSAGTATTATTQRAQKPAPHHGIGQTQAVPLPGVWGGQEHVSIAEPPTAPGPAAAAPSMPQSTTAGPDASQAPASQPPVSQPSSPARTTPAPAASTPKSSPAPESSSHATPPATTVAHSHDAPPAKPSTTAQTAAPTTPGTAKQAVTDGSSGLGRSKSVPVWSSAGGTGSDKSSGGADGHTTLAPKTSRPVTPSTSTTRSSWTPPGQTQRTQTLPSFGPSRSRFQRDSGQGASGSSSGAGDSSPAHRSATSGAISIAIAPLTTATTTTTTTTTATTTATVTTTSTTSTTPSTSRPAGGWFSHSGSSWRGGGYDASPGQSSSAHDGWTSPASSARPSFQAPAPASPATTQSAATTTTPTTPTTTTPTTKTTSSVPAPSPVTTASAPAPPPATTTASAPAPQPVTSPPAAPTTRSFPSFFSRGDGGDRGSGATPAAPERTGGSSGSWHRP